MRSDFYGWNSVIAYLEIIPFGMQLGSEFQKILIALGSQHPQFSVSFGSSYFLRQRIYNYYTHLYKIINHFNRLFR
jgi:hypothetical protein